MPRAYKSRKFGDKISARFRDMNFRNLGEKSKFLELGEFPTCENRTVGASWSRLGVCQIWSESVKLSVCLRMFFCLSPCNPRDRADEYTIYIVVKGLVTESVIRTPLHLHSHSTTWMYAHTISNATNASTCYKAIESCYVISRYWYWYLQFCTCKITNWFEFWHSKLQLLLLIYPPKDNTPLFLYFPKINMNPFPQQYASQW